MSFGRRSISCVCVFVCVCVIARVRVRARACVPVCLRICLSAYQ